MEKPWSLYNKEDKLRVDDLTAHEVRIVLLATASKRMLHWYACQEGDVHWQSIADIPEFYEDVRQIKGPPEDEEEAEEKKAASPPVQQKVERRPLFEDAPDEQVERTVPTVKVENFRTSERRTARRYDRELDFRVTVGPNTFKCETVDISMSGMQLNADLPAWVPKYFVAELSMNKKIVKVSCSKVSATKLKIKDSSSWDVIRAWLVNW